MSREGKFKGAFFKAIKIRGILKGQNQFAPLYFCKVAKQSSHPKS
jgi:hypothetical protein